MSSGSVGQTPDATYYRCMRLAFTLCILSAPAAAWEFTAGIPCVLHHDTGSAQMELTYDPRKPVYSITVTGSATLPDTRIFAMRFDGPDGLTISTNQHRFSANGTSVTVVDQGFGNVLNGLQVNQTATAILGDTEISFPLAGASDAVAAFRECRVAPAV